MIQSRNDRMQFAAQSIAQPTSVISPVTGWNTRDPLDGMAPTDAVQLDNLYPGAAGVGTRGGTSSYATGIGSAPVMTLAEYISGQSRNFFACGSGGIYDISAGGVAPAPLSSGFFSNIWQTINFGRRLFFVNGQDHAQVFDGLTLGPTDFTGVDNATLIGVATYQNRLYFWRPNEQGFWYGGLNSISGPLNFFDLSLVTQLGGNLIATATFSHDGGNGVIDVIAFIMSSGDALLYFGNDPGNVATWQLIGKYRISPPVGPRAIAQYGADAWLTTSADHTQLQQILVALKIGELPPRSKIAPSVAAAFQAGSSSFGWQAFFYPQGRRIIFNIPTGGAFDQHIFNTETNAWCRFTDMDSFCWGLSNNNLFFGTSGGEVYQADVSWDDSGANIDFVGQQAWTMQPSVSRQRITAVRPVVQYPAATTYLFGLGFDYGDINVSEVSITAITGTPWDTTPWDTAPWSPETQVDGRWRVGGGTGQAVSAQIRGSVNQPLNWLRTDFRIEPGIAL